MAIPVGSLLARERELAAVDALLHAAADGAGGALVVAGEAGSGKSALLAEVAERARTRGFRVCAARADWRDRAVAFGVVRDLFGPLPRAALLSGAAAAAAPALDLARGPALSSEGDSVFEVAHGLYWLAANLAEQDPLLVAVDDVQSSDPASLRFLEYLARRVEELPLALVVAVSEDDAESSRRLLSAIPARTVLTTSDASAASDGVHDALRLLARQRASVVALAQAAAVLGRDAALVDAAAIAGLEEQLARDAAKALAGIGVVERGEPLRFVNSKLEESVYAEIGLAQRSGGHRRAAELLDRRAPDRAVGHLLEVQPTSDPWVLERLRAGAERALARGSSDAARTLLERALDEAPAGDDRARVLLALGRVERYSKDVGAVAELEAALSVATAPDLRAGIVRELVDARLLRGDGEAARSLLEWAKRELPDPMAESWLELEASRVALMQLKASASEAASLTGRLARVEDMRDDTPAQRRLLALLAFHRFIWTQTTAASVARLAERALAGGRLIEEAQFGHATLAALSVLQGVERDRELEAHLETAAAWARMRGLAADLAVVLVLRGRLALFRGWLADAEADLREALVLCDSSGMRVIGEFAVAALVNVLVERGDLEGADAVLEERPFPAEGSGNRYLLLQARAALRRAHGRTAEAAADVLSADRLRSGPAGASILSRTMLALSAHATGEIEQARRIATDAVARAERWGVAGLLGIALRTQGLIEQGGRGLELLTRAETSLAASPRRLEHARTLVELGAARRRAGEEGAREAIEAGMKIAHFCAATPLAERARDELAACGVVPRPLGPAGAAALTPGELQVAKLAASGRSEHEIAQSTFLTCKTVEAHLAGIYRKLGTTTGDRLAALLDPPAGLRAT